VAEKVDPCYKEPPFSEKANNPLPYSVISGRRQSALPVTSRLAGLMISTISLAGLNWGQSSVRKGDAEIASAL